MAVVTPFQFDEIYGISEAAICNRALSRIGADTIKDTEEDTKQSRICKSVYSQTRDELLRLYPFNFATRVRKVPLDTAYQYSMELYNFAYKAIDKRVLTANYTIATNTITVAEDVYQSDIGLEVSGSDIPESARIIAVDEATKTITIDRLVTDTKTGESISKYIPLLKVVHIGGNNNNLYELIGSGDNARILTNMSGGVVNSEQVLDMRCVEQVINPDLFDSIFTDALVLRIAMKIAISFTQAQSLVVGLYQEFAQMLRVAQIASAEEKEIDPAEQFYTEERRK